jgi:hypothetical protein
MSPTVCNGSNGFDVALLQFRLKNANASDLEINGIFSAKTLAAIKAFQTKHGLKPDGAVDQLTQEALAKGPEVFSYNHDIKLIPQPTPTSCWAAATAMMTRSTPQAVIAKTPKAMIGKSGGLKNSSKSDQAVVEGAKFAGVHGLRCFPPMSWLATGLCAKIRQSPLAIEMLLRTDKYVVGKSSPGHFVIVDAFVTDNSPDSKHTYLHVLNPLPPNVGESYWVEYVKWMQDVPTRTYRIFSR